MKMEIRQTYYRDVSAFLAVLSFLGAVALSFCTSLIFVPVVYFALAPFFYAIYLIARQQRVSRGWLLLVNIVVAAAGIGQLFFLDGAGELLFLVVLFPLLMCVYYVPYWTASIGVVYVGVFVGLLASPLAAALVEWNAVNIKVALLLVAGIPMVVLLLRVLVGSRRQQQPGKINVGTGEQQMFNLIVALFYRLRTLLTSLKGAMQILKGEQALEPQQQLDVKRMLENSVVALNDVVDSLFVSRSLSSNSAIPEQFDLHARIKARVKAHLELFDLDDMPVFSFDPSLPQYVEGDGAYVDQVVTKILGSILSDNLMAHEQLNVSTLVLGAPRGESLLVKIVFECGQLVSKTIDDVSLFNDGQEALLGGLRIRRAARGVEVSFTVPFVRVSKLHLRADVVEVAKVELQPRSRSASERLAEAKILIVEDNAINRRVMGITLQHEVASITLAEDGREAVDLAAKNGYDLILMDVQMPVMDGYKATHKIREMEYEQGRGEHVPIIALTAYALRGDRERCLRAGMDHYIAKPFQKNALLAAMAMVLSKARRQVE